jgi:hemerythrin-like domain-containing protein
MSKLLERLNQDHKHLAHLLDMLDRQLDRFHEGHDPEFELLCEMLEYIECYADQAHHPSEELMFDVIEQRTGEKAAVLELLRNQHESLKIVCMKFRQALEGIVHETVLRRDEVEQRGREFVRLEREHLNIEEGEIFPLARKVLKKKDWEKLDKKAPNIDDPVFGDRDHARFRTLYQHLTHSLGA